MSIEGVVIESADPRDRGRYSVLRTAGDRLGTASVEISATSTTGDPDAVARGAQARITAALTSPDIPW